MGHWTLQSVSHRAALHETAELFGNHYIVDFKLRYTKAMFDSYKETPKLDWHEVIMMNDHAKRQHWEFTANMYEHNPLSKTLEVWAKRYILAYEKASGLSNATVKGDCTLVDTQGRPVSIDKIGRGITDKNKQADAVRKYLSSHGGGFDIQIDDIPSINIPTHGEHKERLLIFDCGVVGGGPRTKAIQYLVVDHAKPKNQWTRRFDLGWTMTGMKTTGLARAAAPAQVSNPRPPLFTSGECW